MVFLERGQFTVPNKSYEKMVRIILNLHAQMIGHIFLATRKIYDAVKGMNETEEYMTCCIQNRRASTMQSSEGIQIAASLQQWFPKCLPWTSSIHLACELGHADSLVASQIY